MDLDIRQMHLMLLAIFLMLFLRLRESEALPKIVFSLFTAVCRGQQVEHAKLHPFGDSQTLSCMLATTLSPPLYGCPLETLPIVPVQMAHSFRNLGMRSRKKPKLWSLIPAPFLLPGYAASQAYI